MSAVNSMRNSKMRRTSLNQPAHRRAFWAKTASSYHAYITNPNMRIRTTGDHGMDNFSYDQAHMQKCEIPPTVVKHPTRQLLNVAYDWIYGEAAIFTSLSRIEALNEDAPYRLDPETTHRHILGRRLSDDSSTTTGAESTASSSPVAMTMNPGTPATPLLISAPAIPSQKVPLMYPTTFVPINMAGLESPPFTPIDSTTVNTPPHTYITGTVPDLAHVTAQLSSPLTLRNPLTRASSGYSSHGSGSDAKNDQAWEHYLETLDEEFRDLRNNVLARLKGYGHQIRVLLTEEVARGKLEMVEVKKYNEWFKTKVCVHEERIYQMEKKTRGITMAVGGAREHRMFVTVA